MMAAKATAPPRATSRILQHGLARLRATADHNNKTRLTQVSHQAPMRLVPIPSSSIQHAGAAVCALSSYGGGMLPGDLHEIHVDVQENATLGLITQGPSRIYKRNNKGDLSCQSTLHAHVASNALFVLAIDPCIPFQHSSFQQSLSITLEPEASAILVDWFGAGRLSRGECWDLDSLSSRTLLYKSGQEFPFLVDSTHLNNSILSNTDNPFGLQGWNAYCSVILHGPQAQTVAQRLQELSYQLTSQYTRVRHAHCHEDIVSTLDTSFSFPPSPVAGISGRALLGVNEIVSGNSDDDFGPTFLARLATTCNEDMYRILHACLTPLSPKFGIQFYRDRIHSSQTFATAHVSTNNKNTTKQPKTTGSSPPPSNYDFIPKHTTTNTLSWSALMLADSGLPTGSFAHSAGIEVAAQLGLLRDEHALQDFIHAAIRSCTQLHVPFVMESQTIHDIEDWCRIDHQMHAYMVSNSVSCRASLEQGQGLLRVALSWLRQRQEKDKQESLNYIPLLQQIQEAVIMGEQQGHLAPIFGIVCSSLGLSSPTDEACRLLGYCAARDMVSAAVRLNLIGPLAGVSLLDSCRDAVEEGIASAQVEMVNGEGFSMIQASTCAPIVETVHPCHEMLSVRLFKT